MMFIFMRSLTAIFIAALILGGTFIYITASNINEMTVYKETDRYRYYTLTYNEIQNAPRISQHYYFESHPGDGYPPSNDIIFKDTTNAEPLRVYLINLGYIKERRRKRGMEVWCQPKKECRDRFYLYVDKHAKEVRLTSIQD
ncbi:hypothetical protein [Leclercia adecarboxylata]|jgi:hypothetical protein|uniref:Uncharacterized protein n=1 Tax=Leclercia adecarboxylata TaxID=83655 RepID=A0A9X3Y608_9ENTR|nr:hypothetical protein [Leclercia adecarboxylata]MCE9977015.1 hypothetical protein [Leclercia adecarboxylata]MCH2681320.1 hypothetical protein [Leclercia adecarboxylata]MCU6673793.1 hypothetical protein [Leclercia adecarboxylata]MCV3304649.1 hypothetical protein [Leclercia adecarboxylata]MCV3308669.1 hypothetical protein [Leclercia adecarboxylata]